MPKGRSEWKGWKPMFPGSKFGGPSFVQYGQDNKEAVDGYVYAVSGDQWDNGKELRVGRVLQDRIIKADSWEWADVQSDGSIDWIGCLDESKPVLVMDGHISLPEMVYLPEIK